MFDTLEKIEEYLLAQDAEFADKVLNAYNVMVRFVEPQTVEQHEEIMWMALDCFNLI